MTAVQLAEKMPKSTARSLEGVQFQASPLRCFQALTARPKEAAEKLSGAKVLKGHGFPAVP